MFRKILVALDGSPHAHTALTHAIDVAQHYGASLCLLHAYPHVPDLIGTPLYEQLVATRTMIGEQLLAAARAEIGDRVPVETQLLEGPPAQAILRVAEAEQFDLIVVGSRGHGGVGGLLLGSVSSAVAQRAHCPVLIVH